jgi:metal-responsive CopG/Arc/MetJ family transcriptional regulator
MMQTNSFRVVFGLPDDLLRKIDDVATKSGLSRSRVVVRLLELGLNQPEHAKQSALLNRFPPSEKESSHG